MILKAKVMIEGELVPVVELNTEHNYAVISSEAVNKIIGRPSTALGWTHGETLQFEALLKKYSNNERISRGLIVHLKDYVLGETLVLET